MDIEQFKLQAEQAEREGDYGRVAELRYGKIKEAEKSIEELQKQIEDMDSSHRLMKEEVDAEDIADIVSRWTGIPVSKMMESER